MLEMNEIINMISFVSDERESCYGRNISSTCTLYKLVGQLKKNGGGMLCYFANLLINIKALFFSTNQNNNNSIIQA